MRNLTSLRQPSIRDVSFTDLHKGIAWHRRGWWALSAPISWKPCLVSVRKPKAPLRCTVRNQQHNNASEAINNGFALVTEGVVPPVFTYLDINFNSFNF